MLRGSILANVPLRAGRWNEAAEMLEDCERKVPPGLGDKRVDRAWRNIQRELWFAQLRRAVSLWKAGNTDRAVGEAARAEHSDEEYVRSGAILLLAAADFTRAQGSNARARLSALAGHDPRFAGAVAYLQQASANSSDASTARQRLQASLGALGQSLGFVSQPLCEIVVDAARAADGAPQTAARPAVPPLTVKSAR